MDDKCQFNRFRERLAVLAMVVACLFVLNLGFCWSLNDEGLVLLGFRERVVSDPFGALSNWNDDGDIDPCSWNGVECSDGKVVVLNLKDLCLGGTLAPELKNLVHIKSIMLRNNSFEGVIPEGFGKLEELEVLDLGYNNFSGPLPADLGSNLSLTILLLDNNGLLGSLSPEIYILEILSEFQVDESLLSGVAKDVSCSKIPIARKFTQTEDFVRRKLQQANGVAPFNQNNRVNGSNSLTASEAPSSEASIAPRESLPPSPSPSHSLSPLQSGSAEMPRVISSPDSSSGPPPEPPLVTPSPLPSSASSKDNRVARLAGSIGGGIFLIILVIGIYLYMNNNVATVRPWATGLSGQLQKAFVTGVPKLKRSELVTACEDFSNVIGTSPIGTVYKGTLSNGVEIAVASVVATSSKDWSRKLEVQFRKKIDTLSKLNHKNFVNLIGYCVEEEPFTRMLVFEYAPNGTLFEHLHIKESEHLDWIMRVRIAMGMAYCLEHMHQLQPSIAHNNLNSSAIRLTEDYAAKVSEFSFWNKIAAADGGSPRKKLSKTLSTTSLESNVYCFGVILFEMVTGRLPYSVDNGSFDDWASDYMRGNQPLKEMVDPTLTSFLEEELEQLGEVIKFCVHPDPKQRPTMRQVSTRLREISGISPDGATPKLSPLWWAELELISTEAI